MIAFLLLQLAGGGDGVAADLRARTAATIPCASTSDRSEVVVCALRRADRYRVSFVEHEAGDPKHETVMAERTRLQARTSNCQEKRVLAYECGMAGASVRTSGDGGRLELRPPAP